MGVDGWCSGAPIGRAVDVMVFIVLFPDAVFVVFIFLVSYTLISRLVLVVIAIKA